MGIEKKVLSIRLDEELINEIKSAARQENRPVSNYIETVLKNHLKNQALREKQSKLPPD